MPDGLNSFFCREDSYAVYFRVRFVWRTRVFFFWPRVLLIMNGCILRLGKRVYCWGSRLCLLLSVLCVGCSVNNDAQFISGLHSTQEETTAQKLGIEVESLRLSAANYMLDFRYRAVDPERASILFDRQVKPYLIHENTGAKFLIPAPAKVGPLRQTTNKPVAGKSYFMMFANPGQYVKAGDKVTVVIGDFRLEHLTVE